MITKTKTRNLDIFVIKFIPIEQLKIEIRKLGIKTVKEYKLKRKANWPCAPDVYYKEEWIDWYDLFGIEKPKILSLQQLKVEVKKLKIKTVKEYKLKRKKYWPAQPDKYYKEKWIDWYDLFGIEKPKLLSLKQLKVEVRKLKISSQKEYRLKRKKNWPSLPDIYYKEWKNWYDLFKTKKPEFLSLKELTNEVRKLQIKNTKEYILKRKKNWPYEPDKYYKNEWISFTYFFGTERVTLQQLKNEVRKLKIKNTREYRLKRKFNWPSRPDKYYKEWKNWHDLFGKIQSS